MSRTSSDPSHPRRSLPRRILRFGAFAALILIGLLAVVFFLITDATMDAPILGTPQARATEGRLEEAMKATLPTRMTAEPLRVGWASESMTPPVGTPTFGYGARRGRGTERIADELMVHALALSVGDQPPCLILSADICLWPTSLSQRITRGLAAIIPRKMLYFGATENPNVRGRHAGAKAIVLAVAKALGERGSVVLGILMISTGAGIFYVRNRPRVGRPGTKIHRSQA